MSDRTILKISGPDARDFLQGLVTNDIAKLDRGLVYAAMLTPQGKFRADFFLVPDGDAILLDIATPLAADIQRALMMYKLRSAVEIEETDRVVSRGLGTPPAKALPDPRHASLGWRGYDGQPDDPEIDWNALRVAALIPDSTIELNSDSFILEMGFERLNGVDFKKGCYVGQEVTARMKHKTELRKGLAQVDIDGSAPVGTEITAGGKPAGTLFTQSDGKALAYLRFDRAKGDLTADGTTVRYTAP